MGYSVLSSTNVIIQVHIFIINFYLIISFYYYKFKIWIYGAINNSLLKIIDFKDYKEKLTNYTFSIYFYSQDGGDTRIEINNVELASNLRLR